MQQGPDCVTSMYFNHILCTLFVTAFFSLSFSGTTLPSEMPRFNTKQQYFEEDEGAYDEKISLSDIYEKNSNFSKYKDEFKQQINFTGTLYR